MTTELLNDFEGVVKILDLKPCPQCGDRVEIGYACGEYFIMPRERKECACCNFTEMHSNIEQEIEAWNQFATCLI